MRKQPKRLNLNRETIATLGTLRGVRGGTAKTETCTDVHCGPTTTETTVNNCPTLDATCASCVTCDTVC